MKRNPALEKKFQSIITTGLALLLGLGSGTALVSSAAPVSDYALSTTDGLASFLMDSRISRAFNAATQGGAYLDGVQIDNLMTNPTFDLRPETLAAADQPLGYTPYTSQPVVHTGSAREEFLPYPCGSLDENWGSDRAITINLWGLGHPNYPARYVDGFGSDGPLDLSGESPNWNPAMLDYRRTLTDKRPYLFTIQVSGVTAGQAYTACQLALLRGVYPGHGPNGYDRDPAADQVVGDTAHLVGHYCAAGWEPLTYTWTGDEKVWVERFGTPPSSVPDARISVGTAGYETRNTEYELFFPIHNRSEITRTAATTIETTPLEITDPAAINLSDIAMTQTSPFSVVGGDIVVELALGPEQMRVLQLRGGESSASPIYLPSVGAQWHRPWPSSTATPKATPPAPRDIVIIPIGDSNPSDPTVRPLLGVIAGPNPNAGFTEPNLTNQYQDIGVLSVRNNDYFDDRLDMEGIFNCGGPTYPSWEGCDANDDAYYNWGPSDAQFASYLTGGFDPFLRPQSADCGDLVAGYLAGGFDPFLRLGGEWANGDRPHDFKGPQNATQEANWIIAAHKVVDRYLHWDGAEQTFTYLDIWTEFPGGHFWDRSNIEFITFWVRAYASLKGTYPQLKVGGPGFVAGETMRVIQGDANLSRALLAELYQQGLHLDWFGWHLFSNDPTQWAQAALAYRQLLDGTGPYADVPWADTGFFADTEIIVDAYGLVTPDKYNQIHTGSMSASLLTAAWIAMQYGDVERAYYYRGNDFGTSSPGDGSGGPGLFYGDAAGTYKPGAHAFRLWSRVYRRYPHLLQVTLPSTDPQLPLWVLAAQDDQGDIALLAANPSADAVTWSPRFADGTTLQDYARVELYQVDETQDGRTPTPFTGSTVTTAAYTVQLLILHPAANPQIGLNFIRFFWGSSGDEPDLTTPYLQPGWIFNDFAELGIHTFRQSVWADLLWNIVEPQDDEWNFDQADAVITNPDFEPIVTLFRQQYASATPPWATNPSEFQKTLGPEARDYLETIIERYGPYVKYWEIGNEMDHWRAADPDAVNPQPPHLPPSYPLDGFSPQEQGVFLAQVAAFIRERDPDAVILMPGMSNLDDYTLNTWFAGVIEGGGADCFDVVNYHYYSAWQPYGLRRQDLQAFLEEHNIASKPVWLTETGSTASPTLTIRTDYPNSPVSQAADVFRRLIQAYGHGDSLAMWHSYIGSSDTPGNDWRLYGIRTDTAEAQPSYSAFKLLVQELIPFESVEVLSSSPDGENSFKITTSAGDIKYVAWGSGIFAVPAGMTELTSVIPNADGSFTWQDVEAGDVVTLAPEPVLLKGPAINYQNQQRLLTGFEE